MGGRGSKINNPWNREGEEGHIFCKSYCVCVCEGGGGGGRGGECEEDQNLLIFPFLDSVLYEIQNKETKKKKKRERERERERESRESTLLATSYPIKGYFPLIGL